MMNALASRHDWRVPTAAFVGVVAAVIAGKGLMASTASWHAFPGPWWLLIVVAPWAEEVIFRLGLQESLLRRWPTQRLAANVATALAFGLAHACIRQDAAALLVMAPALLMGQLYGRWRLVWPCVALHAAMNTVWLLGLRELNSNWIGA